MAKPRRVRDPGALVTAALIGFVYLGCLIALGFILSELATSTYMHG